MILGAIGQVGVAGGVGYVVEYAGDAIRALSMEQRMTICNMSIEWGARAGMIAPDETTFAYLEGRPQAPAGEEWERAVEDWRSLASDPDAAYDTHVIVDVTELVPQVTWGTNPGMVVPVTGTVPDPATFPDADDQVAGARGHGRARHGTVPDPATFGTRRSGGGSAALEYMGLRPGQPIEEIRIDRVFIGSCTNSRIEDLRAAAEIVRGRTVDPAVTALVVPGSAQVRRQAQAEGLDQIFLEAGFEWRLAGCSMCLGMNPDVLAPGERCASTSNRNFEGRQGRGGRTHLVSPQMAAAAALHGHFVDVRSLAAEAVPA